MCKFIHEIASDEEIIMNDPKLLRKKLQKNSDLQTALFLAKNLGSVDTSGFPKESKMSIFPSLKRVHKKLTKMNIITHPKKSKKSITKLDFS